MPKKIALLYSYGVFDNLTEEQARIVFLRGPDNIGNLVYLEVIRALFKDIDLISAADLMNDPVMVREKYFKILLPFSNMLSPYFSTPLCRVIHDFELPIILFSIGVQAPLEANISDIVLSADSLALLNYCNSSKSLIGVRGALSQELLYKYKIKSKVVGCPSFSQVPFFSVDRFERVVVNSTLSGHHRDLSSGVISFGIKNNASYALQDEGRLIADRYDIKQEEIGFSEPDSAYAKDFDNILFDYGYYNDGVYEWGAQRDWFRNNSFFLTSYSNWISKIKKFDVSIGTRIHGNALALLNGIPALFVPCDLRCLELCQYHMLPTVESVNSDRKLRDVATLINYEAFFENLSYVKNNLLDYWCEVGISDYLN